MVAQPVNGLLAASVCCVEALKRQRICKEDFQGEQGTWMFMDLEKEKPIGSVEKSVPFQTRGIDAGIQWEQKYEPPPVGVGWYKRTFNPALSWVGRRASDHSPCRVIPRIFWCRGTMLSGQVKGAGKGSVPAAQSIN